MSENSSFPTEFAFVEIVQSEVSFTKIFWLMLLAFPKQCVCLETEYDNHFGKQVEWNWREWWHIISQKHKIENRNTNRWLGHDFFTKTFWISGTGGPRHVVLVPASFVAGPAPYVSVIVKMTGETYKNSRDIRVGDNFIWRQFEGMLQGFCN